MITTWRDDDIGAGTKLDVLAAVDDVFQKYAVPHTIAVMAAGMDRRPDLVELIRERRMIVQLHCWNHDDLTTWQAQSDLSAAVEMIDTLFGARPSILYPTWNRSNSALEVVARGLGLTVSTAKISIEQYLRAGGDVAEDVVNFHHWHVPEAVLLEPALKLASGR